MAKMIAKQLPSDSAERLLHRRNLSQNVGAVAVFADHALQPANLALNAAQPFLVAGFNLGVNSHRSPDSASGVASAASRANSFLSCRWLFEFLHGYELSFGHIAYTPIRYIARRTPNVKYVGQLRNDMLTLTGIMAAYDSG